MMRVEELPSFPDVSLPGGPPSVDTLQRSKTGGRQPESATDELQAEMKLLNWHKLANEAALKTALIRTKKLRKMDKSPPSKSLQEKAAWMQQVIEEEQRKPLQVSKDFIQKYEEHEKAEEERLDSEVQRHIDVLRKLREKVKERDDLRKRKEVYREKKEIIREEKQRALASAG